MQELIQELYESINYLGFQATYHRDNNYIRNSKGLISEIQKFVQWFMVQEQFCFEKEIYDNLLGILKDCESAIRENDTVLMMDALEQGISGYLEMFLTEEYFKEREKVYVGGIEEKES